MLNLLNPPKGPWRFPLISQTGILGTSRAKREKRRILQRQVVCTHPSMRLQKEDPRPRALHLPGKQNKEGRMRKFTYMLGSDPPTFSLASTLSSDVHTYDRALPIYSAKGGECVGSWVNSRART